MTRCNALPLESMISAMDFVGGAGTSSLIPVAFLNYDRSVPSKHCGRGAGCRNFSRLAARRGAFSLDILSRNSVKPTIELLVSRA
jgi:hypothetical protein